MDSIFPQKEKENSVKGSADTAGHGPCGCRAQHVRNTYAKKIDSMEGREGRETNLRK